MLRDRASSDARSCRVCVCCCRAARLGACAPSPRRSPGDRAPRALAALSSPLRARHRSPRSSAKATTSRGYDIFGSDDETDGVMLLPASGDDGGAAAEQADKLSELRRLQREVEEMDLPESPMDLLIQRLGGHRVVGTRAEFDPWLFCSHKALLSSRFV